MSNTVHTADRGGARKAAGVGTGAHTPGPWKASAPYGALDHYYVMVGDHTIIAKLPSYGASNNQDILISNDLERMANALLLAAAPRLLEAAKAAWNCIGELPPTQARVEVATMLRDAVARATGETP